MSAKRIDPEKVKNHLFTVRISEQEQRQIQEWIKKAKESPATNERQSVSQIVRETIFKVIATDPDGK